MPLKQTLLNKLIKDYGDFTVFIPSKEHVAPITTIPTGSIVLDMMLGGGVPRGRLTEIYGVEGSGKTTLALCIVRECLKQNGTAVYFAVEPVDLYYAEKMGIAVWDNPNFLLGNAETAEATLQIIRDIIDGEDKPDLIVLDSVAALCTVAEVQGDVGSAHMAVLARAISKALKLLQGQAAKSNTAVVLVNQIRSNIGPYTGPIATPGGWAIKFYTWLRIDLRRVKDDKLLDGIRVRATTRKNKIAQPFKSCEFVIKWGQGIVTGAEDVFHAALERGFITRRGSIYSLHDEPMGKGKIASIAFLTTHPEHELALRKKILQQEIANG